jgi:mutator protein MutT
MCRREPPGLRIVKFCPSYFGAAAPGTLLYAAAMKVVAVVIRRGDRYLVGRRPPHKTHGGLWEFPGGKLEPGESLADAARREVREELHATITDIGEELAVLESGAMALHFLEASLTGNPTAVEHDALRWCALTELRVMPLAPLDRLFVAQTLSSVASAPVER